MFLHEIFQIELSKSGHFKTVQPLSLVLSRYHTAISRLFLSSTSVSLNISSPSNCKIHVDETSNSKYIYERKKCTEYIYSIRVSKKVWPEKGTNKSLTCANRPSKNVRID